MSFPPEIYLIGAQKSGTTTLAYLLSQHPSICVAKSKEPHFFTRNWCKGLAWYQNQFPNYQDAACIDASVTNSQALLSHSRNASNAQKCLQNVPQRVYSINPKARFIYLLREPIQRTYSGYWLRVNLGYEQNSFGKAIRNDSVYLDTSNYYGQLTLWLEYFPLESFLFLAFDDLKQNPDQVVKDCCKFIGVDCENFLIDPEVKNKSRHATPLGRRFNRFFHRLDNSERGYLVPPSLREMIRRLTTDHSGFPKMPEKERSFLCEYFADKNHKLERLTGLSFSRSQSRVV